MRNRLYRLTFITGLAVGYILGSRAGRERYEQLRKTAQHVAQNPALRNAAEAAALSSRSAAAKAAETVRSKVGDRLPAMAGRTRSLRERAQDFEDDWGTTNT